MPDLKPKQHRAAVALACGSTMGAAAVEAGVSRRALFRWRKLPEFRRAVEIEERAQLEVMRRRLAGAAAKSVRELEHLLADPETSDGIKVKAAGILLSTWARCRPTPAETAREPQLPPHLRPTAPAPKPAATPKTTNTPEVLSLKGLRDRWGG